MESNHRQTDYGKGSLYRPVNRKKYESNWDKISKKKSKREPLTYYSRTKKRWRTLPDRNKNDY